MNESKVQLSMVLHTFFNTASAKDVRDEYDGVLVAVFQLPHLKNSRGTYCKCSLPKTDYVWMKYVECDMA